MISGDINATIKQKIDVNPTMWTIETKDMSGY